MRSSRFYMLILLIWILAACQTTPIPPTTQPVSPPSIWPISTSTGATTAPAAASTSTPTIPPSPSATLPPIPLPTATSTSTLLPTVTVDLSRFDWDVRPPILIDHNPPLIAKAGEIVALRFSSLCRYTSPCTFNANLYYSYGESNDFTSLSLYRVNGANGNWTTNFPAPDAGRKSLQSYYLQVYDPKADLGIRYPLAGTIDLFVASEFISIDLPAQRPAETGKLALKLPWGDGPEAVGLLKRHEYPPVVGPLDMDVADDGRIALLDAVNERVLIFDPAENKFTTIPLPFTLLGRGYLRLEQDGRIAVFNRDIPDILIPRMYILLPSGQIGAQATVFARIPGRLTRDLKVFDHHDSRFVVPFNSSGAANSREVQRQKQSPELLIAYTPDTVRFADVKIGLAFEAPTMYAVIFEKTPQGYVVASKGETFRAIWFDPSGVVLKDVTLPDDYFETEPDPYDKRLAVTSGGDLYVMNTTQNGVQILYAAAP